MLSSLVTAFRQHHPQGSLGSELISLQDGLYIVRATVTVDTLILSTALAAHRTLETADDLALERALSRLAIPGQGASLMATAGVTDPTPEPEIMPFVEPPTAARPTPTAATRAATKTSGLTVNAPSTPKLVALQPNGFHPTSEATEDAGTATDVLPLLADLAPADLAPATPESLRPEASPPADLPEDFLEPSPLALPLDLPIAPAVTAPAAAPPEPPPLDHDLFSLEGIPTPSIDLSDIIAQTDVELQRLGWDVRQGREFLEKTYGKRSRHDLTDEELLEFLLFLETQPTLDH